MEAEPSGRRLPTVRQHSVSQRALAPAAIAGGELASAGGSDAAGVIFCGISAVGAGICLEGRSGFGASGTADSFAAASGLIAVFASRANVSDVGGAISRDCAADGSAGFSDAAGAAATRGIGAGAADAGAADAGAADAGASDADDSAEGFSACWKATSMT